MATYMANQIKNVALAGHSGGGKTSLTEALLMQTSVIKRLGSVAEGNTVSDYDPEEIKRRASLNLTVEPIQTREFKINLLDTPGLFDFAAGAVEGIGASDSVIIVISGKSGVTVGAKKAYRMAKQQGKPVVFFVNKLDHENVDFYRVLEELKASFGPTVCPVVAPAYESERVACLVDLIDMKAYAYDEAGKPSQTQMPQMEHRLEGLIEAISEAVAQTDEDLFEKFFSGEKFTKQELVNGVHKGVKEGSIDPVLCGSALTGLGIPLLLEGICCLLPSADEVEQSIPCTTDTPTTARVFKTISDPFYGKLSFFRVFSGKLVSNATPMNQRTNQPAKVGKLFSFCGKEQTEIKEISAGDIGVSAKMEVQTGDVLFEDAPIEPFSLQYPTPCYSKALTTSVKGDEGKISAAVQKILQEDLTLAYSSNSETKQKLLTGLGDQHLELAVTRLKNKFGVAVALEEVKIPYRETIRKKVKAQGRHKKQTGGHGQFGDVWITFEPCVSDDLIFEEKIFGGAVPKGYFPAVEKGLRESAQHGLLAGYPMVGLKAILVDGSYHPVDSSEMAFKMAASLAYRNGIADASPVLLEPIGSLHVIVPDANTGDMMGELNKRRGRVLGMTPYEDEPNMTEIEADVPMAQMLDFALVVRQMTQGAGSFLFSFSRYEQLPEQLHIEVISRAKSENGEH